MLQILELLIMRDDKLSSAVNSAGSRQDVPPIVVSITKIYPFQVGQFSDTAFVDLNMFLKSMKIRMLNLQVQILKCSTMVAFQSYRI